MEEEIKINGKGIGGNNPSYIIAEIGRTYNDDLKTAEKMIKEIANTGADAIKIQSIEAEELLVENCNTKKHYQKLKSLKRSLGDHIRLKEIAETYGLDFLSTPESLSMVDLLEKVGVKAYKVASLDLVYDDLLRYIAKKQKPVFLSTGMANINEIQDALDVIRSEGNNKIVLCYCVSLYPPKPEEMDLKTIRTFRETFKVIPGFSDHTLGLSTAIWSVALGAKVIEKHFTLDRSQAGADHKVSIEPDEFKKMVAGIRRLEKMLGSGDKVLSERENNLRKIKRRKIVAARNLEKGTKLNNLTLKFKQVDSPDGIQSQHGNRVIGKQLKRSLKKDEFLYWNILK